MENEPPPRRRVHSPVAPKLDEEDAAAEGKRTPEGPPAADEQPPAADEQNEKSPPGAEGEPAADRHETPYDERVIPTLARYTNTRSTVSLSPRDCSE